jgi:hypothetical protein
MELVPTGRTDSDLDCSAHKVRRQGVNGALTRRVVDVPGFEPMVGAANCGISVTFSGDWQVSRSCGGENEMTLPPQPSASRSKPTRSHRWRTVHESVMSAGLNALAFTGGAFDAAHWAQIAFGCFVPAAISGATYILARLTRR